MKLGPKDQDYHTANASISQDGNRAMQKRKPNTAGQEYQTSLGDIAPEEDEEAYEEGE